MAVAVSFRIWSKFQNFPRGVCPQTPLQHWVYVIRARTDNRALAAPTPTLYVFSPLLQSLDPPLPRNVIAVSILVSRDCITAEKQPQNIAGIYKQSTRNCMVFTNMQLGDTSAEFTNNGHRVDWWLWPETNIDLTLPFCLLNRSVWFLHSPYGYMSKHKQLSLHLVAISL